MPRATVQTFDDWRLAARDLIQRRVPPIEIVWQDGPAGQAGLPFASLFDGDEVEAAKANVSTFAVPKRFLEAAKTVSCHREAAKWDLLYRMLWRITHGELHLLEIAADDDVQRLGRWEAQVRRDSHKMKAFVRFRSCQDEQGEHFVAWHRPDHKVIRDTAPFFQRRFGVMRWTILTPDESATWDGHELCYGPGVPRSAVPVPDQLEELWKGYYAATFNPARIKLKMMKREMPVRHWSTLPETQIIPDLLRDAPDRVAKMIAHQEGSGMTAAQFAPEKLTWKSLQEGMEACTACPLYENATQVVPGEGPHHARLALVGEQPGDQEDLQGHPFVGPAGKVLDTALEQAGIDRNEVFTTNAVKHFSFLMKGERRLHKKPSAREMTACKPWVEMELELLKPQVIVCLGATAAQSLIGRDFRIMKQRGQIVESAYNPQTIATWHLSAILRAPDHDTRTNMQAELTRDLALAKSLLK